MWKCTTHSYTKSKLKLMQPFWKNVSLMAWKWVSMLAMWHLTYYLKISRAHHCKILKKPPGIIILLKRQQRTDEGELMASSSDWLNDFWPIYFEVHCNLEVIRVHWCNVWSSSHYKQLTSGFFDPPWRKLMMMPRQPYVSSRGIETDLPPTA